MQDKSTSTSGGVGVAGLLGVAFVVLKLCHVIDWSWWWVTAPFWMPIAAVVTVAVIGFPIYLLVNRGRS